MNQASALDLCDYPKQRFVQYSDEELSHHQISFAQLVSKNFPLSAATLEKIQAQPIPSCRYFNHKFGRVTKAVKLLERVLRSPETSQHFDIFLNLALDTYAIRSQDTMADFESLGMLDHFVTLQKLADAAPTSLNIESLLSFGEMAPVRQLLNVSKSKTFWQHAKTGLEETLDIYGKEFTVSLIKSHLQMPHRFFRPLDADKIGKTTIDAFSSKSAPESSLKDYQAALELWSKPSDIVRWAGKNYSYDFNRGTIMAGSNELSVYEPNEFFSKGCGVCIDFSNFIVTTLNAINPKIKPYLFRMEYVTPNDFRGNPFISHWSAAYEWQGAWYVLGDSKLGGMISGPYKDLSDYRDEYSLYRGLKYHRHDLYQDLSIFYDLPR
ncbi:MAG: hypothetical protein MI867_23355 [Pseudomonadales bacterium]|nr:hypothetical protein [Pseudomonadales bacterium]